MCLPNNYIGIRGTCEGQEPVSGLYINDLQGISLNRAASATDENYIRGVDFLRSNEALAFELVRQDYKAAIARDFVLNTVIDNVDRKISYSVGNYLPLEAGVNRYIKITDRLIDQMASVRINRIELYARNAFNGFQLQIIDGAVTINKTIDLQAGLNSIPIQYVSGSGSVYIGYDANQVELWEPTNYGLGNKCADGCICDCSGLNYLNVEYFRGNDIISATKLSIRNGIAVNASLICDLDSVFCSYVDVFKFAIWVKMGILIVEKYLSSDRINPVVFAAKKDAERLLTQWKGGVDSDGFEVKSEYWKHFTSAYNQVKAHMKTSGSICMECDTTRFIHLIP
jgi:hypothetical protein